ncbi:Uncharacterised protein [Niallia circulans]|uniref:hypothetical protein n=1 Tax=Niallia circulans TaxID=1397 RepID=UPI00077CBF15|nr:hypothetical protein [Niallia circulans]MDR4318710.1 hypothetical protein [Niallia circulans]MED3839329.1 hypothetical protein [Niallia circulans]MED4245312.1 hypothetical protein [Niallia circulans]MED4250847.1 hypothetical protein [Niallia circulans]QKH60131.1 hypothetical protein FOC77_05415 [Niallia circulans]
MTLKEKILIISAIDDFLIHEANYEECFSDEEREEILIQYRDIFDTTSPKDIREGMVQLAHKLFAETRGETL